MRNALFEFDNQQAIGVMHDNVKQVLMNLQRDRVSDAVGASFTLRDGVACRRVQMVRAEALADSRERTQYCASVDAKGSQRAIRIQGEQHAMRLDAAGNVDLLATAIGQRLRFDSCRVDRTCPVLPVCWNHAPSDSNVARADAAAIATS